MVPLSGAQFTKALPSGLSAGNLHPAQVSEGLSTSGTRGNLVFAAVPVPLTAAERNRGLTGPQEAVVLTRRVSNAGPSWVYLVLVGAGTLAVAAIVAQRLSRRFTRPLDDAVAATGRIAEGDLATQVPVAPDDYPELASLSRSINTMAASLSRARGLERQFLMAVSHDLRTPLTSIRGFAEAIAEGAATDTQRAASVIASESRRLERLVGDLLELAKLDARRFSLDVRPTDVGEVVVDTAEGFRPVVEKAGLELVVACGDDQPMDAMADPDRLAQVLANLVENAYKFAQRSHPGGGSGSRRHRRRGRRGGRRSGPQGRRAVVGVRALLPPLTNAGTSDGLGARPRHRGPAGPGDGRHRAGRVTGAQRRGDQDGRRPACGCGYEQSGRLSGNGAPPFTDTLSG